MLLAIVWFLFGCVVVEFVGTRWHYAVTHGGMLGSFLNWVVQGRHYHHHAIYHKDNLTDKEYRKSCELTFHPMGLLLLVLLASAGWLQLARWPHLAIFFLGTLAWGVAVLGKMHDLYHVDEDVIRGMWIFRPRALFGAYLWLRDYHHIHHLISHNQEFDKVSCNTARVFAPFDWLQGTFVHPRHLADAKANAVLPRGLFSGFDVKKISWCGKRWW